MNTLMIVGLSCLCTLSSANPEPAKPKDTETKYRIAWKVLSDKTNMVLRGEPVLTLEEAREWKSLMNEKYPMLFHWIEPVEVKKGEKR
jgi:hypothetical protein